MVQTEGRSLNTSLKEVMYELDPLVYYNITKYLSKNLFKNS